MQFYPKHCSVRAFINTNQNEKKVNRHFLNRIFKLGHIIEICGMPGSGKTHLCMQLCVFLQYHPFFKYLNGNCLFIDSQGGFNLDVLLDMETSLKEKEFILLSKKEKSKSKLKEIKKRITIETIESGIKYCRITEDGQQINLIDKIPSELLIKPEEVKLIVFDNFTELFRDKFLDNSGKGFEQLSKLLWKLNELVKNYELIIVLVNSISTTKNEFNIFHNAPFLDKKINEFISSRILMERISNDLFQILLEKSGIYWDGKWSLKCKMNNNILEVIHDEEEDINKLNLMKDN